MILVTGGTGFIGAHTCLALAQAGFAVTIIDNLSNSHPSVIDRLKRISGTLPNFIKGDIRDAAFLNRVFAENAISAVIHFAGLKAVGESVQVPLKYYDNNVHGTLELLSAMQRFGVKTLVFSSSATVYGDPVSVPIREDFARAATNPYGRSKLIIEDILEDYYRANPDWRIARLRYFNPVGAHRSGLLGEDPRGTPNNLMPYIAQVAVGRLRMLNIFGADYPTPDGTGIRDYIHVMDLAEGHVAALRYLAQEGGLATFNLGTGKGASVFDMIHAFERASRRQIPYQIVGRRPGDIACCFADTEKAKKILGWVATRGIDEMCADTWRWQQAQSHRAE